MATVKVYGVEELIRKLAPGRLVGKPARSFLNRWAIATERQAKANAPVGVTGNLRRSLTHDVDSGEFPTSARVGTNTTYAPYVHEGTRPHWPPIAAITPWARKKGIPPYLVARSIARKGTKAQPFLRDAADSTEGRIPGWLALMASEIESGAP